MISLLVSANSCSGLVHRLAGVLCVTLLPLSVGLIVASSSAASGGSSCLTKPRVPENDELSCLMQPSVPTSRSMLNRDYDQVCSVARSLEILGERWTLLVIRDVFYGKRRFDAIQEDLGVARNVLVEPARPPRRRGDPREARLPGAARPLRVLPDREGHRPLAGDDHDDALGRPLSRRPRCRRSSSITRTAAARSTIAATAASCGERLTPATPLQPGDRGPVSAVPRAPRSRRPGGWQRTDPAAAATCRRCPGCPGAYWLSG